jgi:toxin-antitoxin system PIN domain toxin
VGAFLRVATHPALPGDRFTPAEAATVVEGWPACGNLRLLAPGDRHWWILPDLLIDGQARGALVTDAQLAALAMEYGGVLHTTDRDFARFPGLRWKSPLAAANRGIESGPVAPR